jgi:signal recognition particle subunit SRP54
MADRILGMGDIVSLVEKAQEQFDDEEARRMQKKLARDQFTFDDFYQQLQQIKKMGNIKDLASMIPGLGKAMKDIDVSNESFKSIEAMIQSMTPQERNNPGIFNGSRRKRVALGSGVTIADVNRFVKQFENMCHMVKSMGSGNKTKNMMRAMQANRRGH